MCTDSDSECRKNFTSTVDGVSVIQVTFRSYTLHFPTNDIDHVNSSQRVQFRFVQPDHQGGFCDCWAVMHLNISFKVSEHEVSLRYVKFYANLASYAVTRNKIYTDHKTFSQSCIRTGKTFTTLMDFFGNFGVNEVIDCMEKIITAESTILGFCRGSASVPRGFVSVEVGASDESQCNSDAAVVDTGKYAPMLGEQCNTLPNV